MANKNITAPAVHHRLRTFFASVFGTLALSLVTLSLLVVWANRTLTDTTTYVNTVAPVISQPAVQTFLVTKATDQLLGSVGSGDQSTTEAELNSNLRDLVQTLSPGTMTTSKTNDQLLDLARPALRADLTEVVTSPSFANLWRTTNQSAQAQLLTQIKAGATELNLDLSPAVVGAVAVLSQSKLAPIAAKLQLDPAAAKLTLKGNAISKVHQYYGLVAPATIAIVVLTLGLMTLAVWISVHHLKTLRRILVGTGTVTLVLAIALQLPTIIHFKSKDPLASAAAVAIAHTLFHNLQLAALIISGVCLLAALGSKLYDRSRA